MDQNTIPLCIIIVHVINVEFDKNKHLRKQQTQEETKTERVFSWMEVGHVTKKMLAAWNQSINTLLMHEITQSMK